MFTKDNSIKMKFRAKESIIGLTRKPTEAPGSRTKCMARVLSSGPMASFMKELSKTISVKAMVNSLGKTAESTMESGKMENRTVKASSLIRKTSREEASGKVAKILNG